MKTNLSFFIFVIITINLFAQDTILKRNNELIIAKILEISTTEIKYKKFNFLDGPTYIENKSEVKEVIFSNGMREKFAVIETLKNDADKNVADGDYFNQNSLPVKQREKIEHFPIGYKYGGIKIGEKEMQSILSNTNDQQIIRLVQSAKKDKKLQAIGFAAIPFGIVAVASFGISAIAITFGSSNSDASPFLTLGGIMAGGAITCPIVAGIFHHKRNIYNKEAIKLFNEKY